MGSSRMSSLLPCCTRKLCEEDRAAFPGLADARDVEVRSYVSGEILCTIPVTSMTSVVEVKEHVAAKAGVPIDCQRLFADDVELFMDEVALNASEMVTTLHLVRTESDPRKTNTAYFHSAARFEPLEAGQFTRVRRLAQAINGEVSAHEWKANDGETRLVAVKQLGNERARLTHGSRNGIETNEWTLHIDPKACGIDEDSLTEIGIFCYLARQSDPCKYLLQMLGAFQDERSTWLVTELAEGGELFELVKSGPPISEEQSMEYMWQVLQAVDYLDVHNIGHRDVSLENVLLKNGQVKLTDFGMAVRSRSSNGESLRYFCPVGKDFYRAPECYVPVQRDTVVFVPRDASPGSILTATVSGKLCQLRIPLDATPGEVCKTDIWGYAAPPVDVFASGICMFILNYRSPPWHCARLSDKLFAHFHARADNGIESLLSTWKWNPLSAPAMQLLNSMLRSDASKRPSVRDCLASPWFAPK